MPVRNIIILISALTLAGCASLPAVRDFSASTITLADSVDKIAEDTSASCQRRLTLDVIIRGVTIDQRKDYAAVCAELKHSADLFIDLNRITRAYGMMLGQLADDKLVSFQSEINTARVAIGQLKTVSNNVEPTQLDAAASLTELILKASTDGYRQRQIKRVLNLHGDLTEFAAILSQYIKRAYLPTLASEADNLDSLAEILEFQHIKSEPLRSRELLEVLQQQHIQLTDRKKSADATLDAIKQMLDAHDSLQRNADKLNDRQLAVLLKDYVRQMMRVKKQIETSY